MLDRFPPEHTMGDNNTNQFDAEQFILEQQLRARERAHRTAQLFGASRNMNIVHPIEQQHLLGARPGYLPQQHLDSLPQPNPYDPHQFNLLHSMMLNQAAAAQHQMNLAATVSKQRHTDGVAQQQAQQHGFPHNLSNAATPNQQQSVPGHEAGRPTKQQKLEKSSQQPLETQEKQQEREKTAEAEKKPPPRAYTYSMVANRVAAGAAQAQSVVKTSRPRVRYSTSEVDIPPLPKKKDTKWLYSYEQLKKYKEDHGDCIVPRGYALNSRLASWVAEQRKQYKLLQDGRPSSITPERVRLLRELDFAWNAQEAAYARHLTDLKAYKEEFGDTLVPLNHPKYPKLGLWVKEQRRHFALLRSGKRSHMTEERAEALDELGFCWDTHEEVWSLRLKELCKYKAAHGNCLVPTNYGRLGTWVHHQRRQYKKFKDGKPCHITEERIRALDSLGFIWYPRDFANKDRNSGGDSDSDTDTDSETSNYSEEERPRRRKRKRG